MSFSAAQIKTLQDGLVANLTQLDAKFVNTVFSESLPILGSNLGNAANITSTGGLHHHNALKTKVVAALGNLAPGSTEAQMQTALNNALGDFANVTVSTVGGETQINFTSNKQYTPINISVDNTLGLPGLGVEMAGATAPVTFGYNESFKVGLKADGTYFFDAASENLNVKVVVDGNDFSNRPAKFNDLGGSLSTTGSNTKFEGDFKVAVAGTGKATAAQAGAEITKAATTLSGDFTGDLHIVNEFTGVGAVIPDIDSRVEVGWHFENDVVNGKTANDAKFGDVPTVKITSGLSLPTFFSDFVGPIFGKIKVVTDPISPIVNALATPVPFLGDLGLPNTLADFLGVGPEIATLKSVIDLVNAGAATADAGIINIGSLTLGASQDVRLATFDLAKTFSQAVFDGNDFSVGSQSAALANFLGVGGGIFSVPILNTASDGIFRLIAGLPTDLFTVNIPEINAGLNYSQYIPIIGPLGARIEGDINLKINLGFGFDTTGLNAYRASGDATQIFNGFYISDHRTKKVDAPELSLTASIQAFAELNLALVRAGVGGGLFATVNFDLNDLDTDGKIYLSELETLFNTGDLLNVSGNVGAGLSAYLKVGIGPFSKTFRKNIASVTLLEFGAADPSATLPKLTGFDDGDFVLHLGQFAERRVNGELEDTAEDVWVAGINSDKSLLFIRTDSEGEDFPETVNWSGPIVIKGGYVNPSYLSFTQLSNRIIYSSNPDTGGFDRISIFGGSGNDSMSGSNFGDAFDGGLGKDVLVGRDGEDALTGGPGNDYLQGDRGDDTLDGGPGADTLFGGPGFDKVTYRSAGVGAGPSQGIGVEVHIGDSTKNKGDAAGDKYLFIEEFEGSFYNDIFFGSDGPNYIYGSSGDDELNGLGGDDTLEGGFGADFIFGGTGNDTAVYSFGVTVNLASGTGSGGDAEGDIISNINNLIGGNSADTFTGNLLANVLDGGGGNDTLVGGAGKDTLIGGAGNDRLAGDGFDVASYEDADFKVIVNLTTGVVEETQRFNASTFDDLTGISDIIGSYFNDEIYGNGVDNRIDPKLSREFSGGIDYVDGGGGTDTLVVNYAVGDSPNSGGIQTELGGAFTVVRQDGLFGIARKYDGLDFDIVVFTNMEILDFTGGRQNDEVEGLTGSDTLRGGAGDDTLSGGAGGLDSLLGGDGNDVLRINDLGDTNFANIGDTVDGGAGIDILEVNFSTRNVSVTNTTTEVRSGNLDGSNIQFRVSFTNIERLNITGGSVADKLTGFSGDDFLQAAEATTRSSARVATTHSKAARATMTFRETVAMTS